MANQYNYAAAAGIDQAVYDEGQRAYMLGVYNWMCLGIAFTGALAYFIASTPALLLPLASVTRGGFGFLILFLPIMGIGLLAPRLFFSGNAALGYIVFFIYAGLWGLWIAPMLEVYKLGSVLNAFFATSAMFGAMSLWGYTTKRDLGPMGRFLGMVTFGLFFVILGAAILPMFGITFFAYGSLPQTILAVVVILVFAGLTAYETQQIKNMYGQAVMAENVKQTAVFGAFILYGSFVTMFVWMLTLFGGGDD